MLAFLRELVRTESTPGREEAIVGRIASELRQLGFDDAEVDAAGNAVGKVGNGSPMVLIDCHVDTIPEHSPGRWRHDPFAADIADGRLYGLGVCDMKASAAAAIYGVARLAAAGSLPGTVYVVSSIAEEMMEGAALAATFDRCRPDAVIIGEPSELRLCTGQRGRAKLEVEVKGEACHAAHPEVGINAAEWMAELIRSVAALKHPVHPVLGGRSVTLIDIQSEPYPSVSTVPARCVARFDCRFAPGETEETLVGLVASLAAGWRDRERSPAIDCHVYNAEFETFNGKRYSVPEYAAAWLAPAESPIVMTSLAGLRDAGLPAVAATYGFCTNGSLTAGLRGVPTVGYGIGREQEAHVVDEYVELANLYRGARGYAAIVGALLTALPAGSGARA
jgi:putative selenium metabolism hydrolase